MGENANLIDWDMVNGNLNEMRRSIGQLAIANRNSENSGQPAAKRRRVESPEPEQGDITICSDRFPPLDPDTDSLNDPVRFLIDAAHAKIFVGSVSTLAKFADNILFFPHLDGLTIRACNLPKTAGATLNFKLDFFGAVHTFVFPKDKPCVRAFLKPLLIALKKTEASKQLDHFIIDMDSNSEAIVIRVTLRNGIKKLYKLPVSDVHVGSLPRLIERKTNPNVLVMEARQLLEALETAGSDSRQICFWGSSKDIVFHTVFNVPHNSNKWRKAAIRVTETLNFNVAKQVSFCFSIDELKVLCRFADKYHCPVTLYFGNVKEPLFGFVDIPGLCDVMFTIATNFIYGSSVGNTIQELIPDVDLDVTAATQREDTTFVINQSRATQTISSHPSRVQSSSSSNFVPMEIHQSHPDVQKFVNDRSAEYWNEAIAVRELEQYIIA